MTRRAWLLQKIFGPLGAYLPHKNKDVSHSINGFAFNKLNFLVVVFMYAP